MKQKFISTKKQILQSDLTTRSLLFIKLQSAIHREIDLYPCCNSNAHLPAIEISAASSLLKRIENLPRPTYASAIALRWAGRCQISAHELAHRLADQFAQLQLTTNPPTPELLPDPDLAAFSVAVVPSGLMRFELSDRGLAAWLNRLAVDLSPSNHRLPKSNFQVTKPCLPEIDRFAIQHTYARCCALLRLAHGQNLITLANSEQIPKLWQIRQPQPIPWLCIDSTLSNAQSSPFRLSSTVEQQFICQLLGVWDELNDAESNWRGVDTILWAKRAKRLSQFFQQFHQGCSIWGAVNRELPLAQARLALLQVCQLLLGQILVDRLATPAPPEL